MIDVTGIYCRRCGVVVYSRARHDFRWCPCRAVAVDGGREYTEISGPWALVSIVRLRLWNETAGSLYNDWNYSRDTLGYLWPLPVGGEVPDDAATGTDIALSVGLPPSPRTTELL